MGVEIPKQGSTPEKKTSLPNTQLSDTNPPSGIKPESEELRSDDIGQDTYRKPSDKVIDESQKEQYKTDLAELKK